MRWHFSFRAQDAPPISGVIQGCLGEAITITCREHFAFWKLHGIARSPTYWVFFSNRSSLSPISQQHCEKLPRVKNVLCVFIQMAISFAQRARQFALATVETGSETYSVCGPILAIWIGREMAGFA
jgi:hypothetical protein